MVDRSRIVRSASWRLVEVGVGEVLSFATFLILARLIEPGAFGAVALAGFAVHLARETLTVGFPDLLIKGATLSTDRYSTLFWLNLGLGVVLAGLLCAAAPLLSLVADERVSHLLVLLALSLPLSAVAAVLAARLRRDLRMRSFAARAVVANIAGAAMAIPMALGDHGVYALVAQQLVTALTSVLVLAFGLGSGALPALRWCAATAAEAWRVGRHIIGGSLVWFSGRRLDIVAVAAMASIEAAGLYFVAQRIVQALHMVTTFSLEQITLPALARRREQGCPPRTEATSALRWSALLTWPLVGGVAVSAPVLLTIFGPAWSGAAVALAGLSVAAGAMTITTIGATILLLLDRADLRFAFSSASGVAHAAAAVLGVLAASIDGAAWAIAMAQIPVALLCVAAVARTVGSTIPSLLWEAFHAPLAACGATIVATLGALALAADLPPIATLAAAAGAGVVAAVSVGAAALAWSGNLPHIRSTGHPAGSRPQLAETRPHPASVAKVVPE